MHYYKRNIGEYAKKAGRLTMLQHGSYTLLMDACYDRECFPNYEQAIEWTWASTDAEIDAVKFVLSRFFKLNESGQYVQNRIHEELQVYQKNAETNKRIAQERETKRKQNSTNRALISTNREPDVNEPPPKHKTINNKQETIKEIKETTTPDGVLVPDQNETFNEFWQRYPKSMRKTSKSKCLEVWKRKKLSTQAKAIFDHLSAMSAEYTKENCRYCPAPIAYLNSERWDGAEVGDDWQNDKQKYWNQMLGAA